MIFNCTRSFQYYALLGFLYFVFISTVQASGLSSEDIWTDWENLHEAPPGETTEDIWSPTQPALVSSATGVLFLFNKFNSTKIYYTSRPAWGSKWTRWKYTGLDTTNDLSVTRNESEFLVSTFNDTFINIFSIKIYNDNSLQLKEVREKYRRKGLNVPVQKTILLFTNKKTLHLISPCKNTVFESRLKSGTSNFSLWEDLEFNVDQNIYASSRWDGTIDIAGTNESYQFIKTHDPSTGKWLEPVVVNETTKVLHELNKNISWPLLMTSDARGDGSFIFRITNFHQIWVKRMFGNSSPDYLPMKDDELQMKQWTPIAVHQDVHGIVHFAVGRFVTNESIVRHRGFGHRSSRHPNLLPINRLSFTGDQCNVIYPTCALPRECKAYDGQKLCSEPNQPCKCMHPTPTCILGSDCEQGDSCPSCDKNQFKNCTSCKLLKQEGRLNVNDLENCMVIFEDKNMPSAPTVEPTFEEDTSTLSPSPTMHENTSSENEVVNDALSTKSDVGCIAVDHLGHLNQDELVFQNHRKAAVLCDTHGNCATPGHIVVYNNTAMMMKTYCNLGASCRYRVKYVNSPNMGIGSKISSNIGNFSFTAFAARYENFAEEMFLALLVNIGF